MSEEKPQEKVKIIVNGQPHEEHRRKVSDEEVVELAFPKHDRPREYSVTYKHGPHENPEGVLGPGGSVFIKTDMSFHVEEKQEKVTIIVNGEPHEEHARKVSYGEIVEIAFPKHDPKTTYSVTYKHGPHENPEGILAPGGTVFIKKDMSFRVTATGQS